MKKVLSIVLSLVLVICMMPVMAFAGTTAGAGYSDVEGLACEDAVNVMSKLGVIDGYPDGTYKPEQTVTRAEMAKLVVTALGMADYATSSTSKFTDMNNAQWAIPYVVYAESLSIINGYGNGKFGPNDKVTYDQAITMIVRALGYTTECKEMNGTWPAIYVQKATALGILDGVKTKGAAEANRGDIAMMLYNAVDLPLVYADGDGATQYKTGSTEFIGADGNTFKGTSMLAILNKDGGYTYKVITSADADNAATNIRSQVGVAGKVITDADGDIIAVGDTTCSLVTGKFNDDLTKFTVNDTEYRVDPATALKAFKDSKVVNVGTAGITAKPQAFNNGVATELSSLDVATYKNKTVTLGAKISGKTITQIWSVAEWNAAPQALFTDADAVTIANKSMLGGKTFVEDVNGEIDYTKFVLEGVESLDKIAKDNVVYVYAEDGTKTIRKVSVGTKVVEGTWESLKEGVANSKSAKLTVDGTTYETYKLNRLANTGVNADNAELGDKVKLYLDYSGKVFTMKQVEANTIYGLVLDKAAGNDTAGISGKAHKIRVLTSEGEYKTYELARGTAYKGVAFASIGYGDVIKYAVNDEGAIVNSEVYVDQSAGATTKDVSSAGIL